MRGRGTAAAWAALVLRAAAFAAAFAQVPVFAQVTVNPGALDALPSAPSQRRPPAHPSPRNPAPHTPPRPTAPARPAAPAAPPPRPPAVPTTPPEILALPPPIQVPVARPPPVPVVPVVPDAPGGATPIANGLRITFGGDRSDLNAGTDAALRSFARGVRPNEQQSVNIYAFAGGSPDDPSTARRLALARALAARAVLINEGIASTRIYPRALGSAGGASDPDRVDVVAGPPGPPPPDAPITSGAPTLAPPAEPK